MAGHLNYLLLVLVFMSYFLSSSAVLSQQAIDASKKLMKSMCTNKSGVNLDTLAAIRNGQFADDRKLKCYMSCCLGFMKIIKKDTISYENAKKQAQSQLPPDARAKMMELLDACKDVGGADACEVGFNFVKCSYTVNPNTHVVPA